MWRKQRPPLTAQPFVHGALTDKDRDKSDEELVSVHIPASKKVEDMALKVRQTLPRKYVGLHVRRGDVLRLPIMKKITSPEFLLHKLQQIGITTDMTLFVMTNETRSNWLKPVRKRYRVIRSKDFPELADLISPSGTVDNYLLYVIELVILYHAEIIITTRKSDFFKCNFYGVKLNSNQKYVSLSIPPDKINDLYHPFELKVISRFRDLLALVHAHSRRGRENRMITGLKIVREIIRSCIHMTSHFRPLSEYRKKRKEFIRRQFADAPVVRTIAE